MYETQKSLNENTNVTNDINNTHGLGNDSHFIDLKNGQWSRVSPLAILYFFSKTIYDLVSGVFLYSLPALAAGYSTLKENPTYVAVGVTTFLGLVLINSIAKYWFYFYKLSTDTVEIKQGVFKKSHLDLPFKKIQNVKIVQPLYYRFNKYSLIELDTAGSAQEEAKIVALPLVLAQGFKQMILQIKSTPKAHTEPDTPQIFSDGDQEILLNERSILDLVIHGISNNRVWIFLGFLAPFFNTIGENINSILNTAGIDLSTYLNYQNQSIGLFILHILTIVLLIMLVIVSFSVLGSIFVFYKYQLSQLGDRFIRRSGLFTKHEVSMRLSRIQIAVQQQDWLDLLVQRTNLRFEQNTSVPTSGNQASNINNASKLVVPSVTIGESAQLIRTTFNVKEFASIDFKPISKRFIVRTLLVSIMPLLLLINGFTIIAIELGLGIFLLLAFINSLFVAGVFLRWWRWGYYFEGEFVYIRKGFLGLNYYVFPIGKTQQVILKQSVFMRPKKLADICYVLASGSYTVPFIQESSVREQMDRALLIVARDKPSWM